MIRRLSVVSEQHEIFNRVAFNCNVPIDLVVETDGAGRYSKSNGTFGRRSKIAIPARGVMVAGVTLTVIGEIVLQQLERSLFIKIVALRLIERAFVPVEPEPGHGI